MKKTTINLLITAIVFTIMFMGTVYARQIKFALFSMFMSALFWTVFAEEVRIEKCYTELDKYTKKSTPVAATPVSAAPAKKK